MTMGVREMAPPLCIIQARYNSTRIPGKMLLKLGDETLIARGFRIACAAFGYDNVIVAIPKSDEDGPLGNELGRLDDPIIPPESRIGAKVFAWDGPEDDVLARFYCCAHSYRWHPESVIVRYTPDDPFKTVSALRRVANGERLPVELGGEAFTLAQLYIAHQRFHGRFFRVTDDDSVPREHITHALFQMAPPKPPPGVWTIDTQEDYEAAVAQVARQPVSSVILDVWHQCEVRHD